MASLKKLCFLDTHSLSPRSQYYLLRLNKIVPVGLHYKGRVTPILMISKLKESQLPQ